MINPDDAPREHYSNLADPPWSIVAGGRVLGTGATGTDAWRAVLATAEAERDALQHEVSSLRFQLDAALDRAREAESALEESNARSGRW
jgi:hypothetical protein